MDSLKPAIHLAKGPAPTFVRQSGFTLTEMAVVLVIVALLIGGMILPLSAQQDIRYTAETQKQLDDLGEALYGYAASHADGNGRPFLPCPDTDGNGTENRSGTACTSQEGTLPWADLGLARQDAWGNAFRYRVAAAFSNSGTGFTLMSAGDLRVCTSAACTATLGTALPAVILSTGKNGASATADTDELENLDSDTDFVQRTGSPGGYDDIVTWLPPSLLLQRMVNAGRLP
ncbi:MAG: type II secretion system protein [Rhodocyclaceae bacterium]